MTEKEFRKLGIDGLIELLMVQNDEVLRLQGELDRRKEELASLTERNDRLKDGLNERDAETEVLKDKLNKSDARIHELEMEMGAAKLDQWIGMDEIGSITEAARKLDTVFAEAQQSAQIYLSELMDEVSPRESTAVRTTSRRRLRKPERTGYRMDMEESIEDIERRYLGYTEEPLAEDVEDIERRYRDYLY